jgi:hypothetical protein
MGKHYREPWSNKASPLGLIAIAITSNGNNNCKKSELSVLENVGVDSRAELAEEDFGAGPGPVDDISLATPRGCYLATTPSRVST